jgi:uncharacterized protein
MQLLTPETYTRVPWKNGGGVSITIAGERLPGTDPGDWSGVIWQLGRTDIVQPGPFSDLSGFERLQTVVTGAGLFLDTPTGAIDLSRPFTVVRYDGGTPIVSRLAKGPVGVVNLMARRDMAHIAMVVLRAGEALSLNGGRHVLIAPTEAAKLTASGSVVDLAQDHGLSLDGTAQIGCQSGVILACTVQRIGQP